MKKKNKYYGLACLVFAFGVTIIYVFMKPAPFISLFPIEHYDQDISHWINPADPNYSKTLVSPDKQATRFADFKRHYVGDLSPWEVSYMQRIHSPSSLKAFITDNLAHYSNVNKPASKIGYGLNLRPLTSEWITRLEKKCHLEALKTLNFNEKNRAITVNNTQGRELPTDDVHTYHPRFAGQGYPFDNLQASAVMAGTPIYVFAESSDHAWVLVQSPHFMAWIKSTDIAWVDEHFVSTWREAVNTGLYAITATEIPLIEHLTPTQTVFRGLGYIGMVFPGDTVGKGRRLMIPVRNQQARAELHYALLQGDHARPMPLTATPEHFVTLMRQLLDRPYGWGSMYFYNDCASELKNLFTPFGFGLPIHSSAQVDPKRYTVKAIDLSKDDRQTRLSFLKTQGHPFMTILYDGGHVLLYLGNYPNPDDPKHAPVALSYQDVWALEPRQPKVGEDRRSIIGRSVLLPILPYYPEDTGVASDVDYKYFKLGFLDD
jgi:hypothetical protein